MTSAPSPARVLLISANQEEVNMAAWPLGAASVAAALRSAGHEAHLLDLLWRDDPLSACEAALRGFRPDIIGVSVRNIDDQRMKETTLYLDGVKSIIARCRELTAAPVVLGGAGYSIFPGSALAYCGGDLGLPGEGEASFPELVNRIIAGLDLRGPYLLHRRGSTPAGTRTFISNLDDYPLPDPGIVGLAPYRVDDFWMPVQTRRGCSMACSYCSTPLYRRNTTEEAVAGRRGGLASPVR